MAAVVHHYPGYADMAAMFSVAAPELVALVSERAAAGGSGRVCV